MNSADLVMSRRTAVVGAGIAAAAGLVLVACGKSGGSAPAKKANVPPGGVLGKTSDVPVGSAAVFGDVVVTQPTKGAFKGMSSTCTHQGCTVAAGTDGLIECPCHGSEFDLNGGVVRGPAKAPLPSVNISVQGDSIVRS